MQVIVITRHDAKQTTIYHKRSDTYGVMNTLNDWVHVERRKPVGERVAITVRFSVVSKQFWDRIPETKT